MNDQRRTRTESTRTHNRSLMASSNDHTKGNRDVTHPVGNAIPAKGHHRDDISYGKKGKRVTHEEENEDFKSALSSSDRFANDYGDEDRDEEIDDAEKLTLSEIEDEASENSLDDEDDFGVRDFQDDDEDIEEIKKSSRH